MTMQETDPQERLGGDAPVRFSARPATNGTQPRRPHGWEVVMNFGTAPVDLPDGEVLVASGPLDEGRLPGETAVWLRR